MTKQSMVLFAILAYVLIRSFFIEPNTLELTQYRIENKYLQGIRVVFLSDFHLKKHDYKRLDKIVQLTNKQSPDIVLLGGDYVTGHNPDKSMNPNIIAQKLNLIQAPKYAVFGEHDNAQDINKIKNAFTEANIRILEDTNIRTIVKRRYLDIVGLADLKSKNPNINKALYRTMLPRIIVTHNPDIYYSIMDDVTLIIAGHTHGGQFVIPGTPALFTPSKFGSKFAKGLIKETHNQMVISKGLGVTGIPIRFNCKPEIVVIDFN